MVCQNLSRLPIFLIFFIAAAAAEVAPNDVNIATGPAVPAAQGTVIVAGGFTAGTSPTQDGRIFRDGIPSTCPSKAYPGLFAAGTIFHFEQFELVNNAAAPVCATINFNPDTPAAGNACNVNAHISAYIGSYDPANQAANFVGDVGSSVTQPFSFEVPANSSVILVVSTTNGADPLANCNFEFSFNPAELSLPAGGPALPPPPSIPTLSMYGLAAFALALFIVGLVTLRKRAER